MALPINKSKLPREIKGEALMDLVTKTAGEHGKRPKRSEIKKFFAGTEISQKPYAHLSREKAAKKLEEAYQHFGVKESGKQVLSKEVSRIQTKQQVSQPAKKSSGRGFWNRFLSGKKVIPSGGAYRSSQDRVAGSLPSQPPVQTPSSTQKPRLQPMKRTPSIKV